MRKIILLMLYIINTNYGIAQINNCAREGTATSTDWTKYISGNFNFPNNWNWTQPGITHPVYLNDQLNNPSFNIKLPYFCGLGVGSGSCGNENTLQYELLENKIEKQDIYPEDGWELLVKNFGTGNSTLNVNNGVGVPNPYFVLYNRYNGKMKIYYAIIGQRVANSGYLQIFFKGENSKRATFAHVEPVAQSLQDFHPGNNFKILNDFAQMTTPISYYWLVGEIQTAYDPCTCTSNTSTQPLIVVRPFLATITSIEAKIDGQLTQKLADAGKIKSESNGKTSFLDIAQQAGTAGMKAYTQFEGFRKQAVDFLDKRNGAYKEKVTRTWWEGSGGDQNIPLNQVEDKFKEFMKYDDNAKMLFGVEKIDKYNKPLGLIKQIAGVVPYVGTAMSLIDFFMNGGKKEEPTKPSPPTVFEANLKLSGTLTTPIGQPQIAFSLPGSVANNNVSLNPYYNRTLGVFNIVKAPAMEFFELKPDVTIVQRSSRDRNQCEIDRDDLGPDYEKAMTQSMKQFRLKEDIKYLVNPNANIGVEMIDACFVLEYKGNQPLYMRSPSSFDTTTALPFHRRIGDTTLTFEERIKSIESAGWDLEFVSKGYPTEPESYIRFRSKYMPLQCLKNLNFMVWGGKAPKLYVKMLLKSKRNDIVEAEGVTNIVTYDISKSAVEASKNPVSGRFNYSLHSIYTIYSGSLFCCGKFQCYSYTFGNLRSAEGFTNINSIPIANPYYILSPTIDDAVLTSSISLTDDVTLQNVFIKNGVTIRTLKGIRIGQNVTFEQNVTLIAGTSIDGNSSALINSGVTLIIERALPTDIFGCNNPNITALQATNDEIYGVTNGICNNRIYKDSTEIQTLVAGEKDGVNTVHKAKNTGDKKIIKLDCSPNPFSNFFTINYELGQEENINIVLLNSLGQVVKSIMNRKVESGFYQEHISTEDLPGGIYFLNFKTANGIEIKKVIKQ